MADEEKPSQTPRGAIRRATRISDERDQVRNNPPPPSVPPKSEWKLWGYVDKAVLSLFELLALMFGLPFGDDLFHEKPVTNLHLVYLGIGALFALGGPMFPLVRTIIWIPKGVTSSISSAARDARIWIAILLIFFLYGVAPDIYRRATAPVAAPTCWDGKAPPCNEQQTNAPSNQELTKALESSRQQGVIVANQLGAALIERDKLKAQLDELSRRQNAAPLPSTASSFETTYSLSQADILKLRDEFFKAKNAMPSVIVLQTADDGQSRGVANALSKAIGLAGIEPGGQSIGYPVTPQETGISIRVSDLEGISSGAKAFADVIKKVTGVEPRYTIGPKPIGEREGGFWVFVGTNPKEN